MSKLRFVRAALDGVAHVGRIDGDTVAFFEHDDPLAAIRGEGTVVSTVPLNGLELLAPVEAPEIWCAGVTYERSRDARLEEAQTDARDVYALVYDADRPELFMKDASMRRTVGPGGSIRLRSDSSWMVPEPELGLVFGEHGEPVAVTIGNDVSSRDIEGANPLYIPQAKIFAGACAIGPWAMRDNPIPPGSVLLTGTGLVPPDDYTLEPGHTVEIEIEGIGALSNTVAA